jgi:hypothetical protein
MEYRIIEIENVRDSPWKNSALQYARTPRKYLSLDPDNIVSPSAKESAYAADVPAGDFP